MTGFADVSGCINTAWQTVGITYPTATEGRDFSPPSDAPWCATYQLPVSAMPAAVGAGSPIEHLTLLQVDVHHPLNSGTAALLADADKIAAAFTPGTTFVYNTLRLMSERCDRSPIRRDDASNVVSLTVRLRGWQHRSTP